MYRSTIAASAALLLSFAASAEVPRFADIAGHEIAERISTSGEIEAYLQRLAAASPRVTYQRQGRSWEGRPLMLAVVTSPENHARLDEIRDVARRLDDPRLSAPTAAELQRQPVIVWLGGSIHGFELSGTEGLLLLLEHLTTRDDADTQALLANTVVLVDPILNPDGRDAFAHRNHKAIGNFVSADRRDWSNDFTPWEALTYRGGHYFFDTNRDWFVHSQRETRERMPTFRAWRPQVAVDLHEMGPDNEFFFDPPTEPSAPYFPAYARSGFELFGSAYARAFDAAGFDYTTRQFYNYFYPGYTTSWTSYQGAIGMLYEQGSSRGLALERSDGTVRTLRDAATQQYTAALTALRTSATNRTQLLDRYATGARDALADGDRGTRRYVIAPGDPGLAQELAAMLERNGIEVQVTTAPTTLRGVRGELPAGTLVVEAAQPRNRLLRTLLEPHLPVPEAFLAEARARLERNENPRFYDITAFSLPHLFNLDARATGDGRRLETVRWSAPAPAPVPEAAYAWLIDGRQAATAAAATMLRRDGIRVRISPVPFSHGGHAYGSGTAVVRAGGDATRARLSELAEGYGLEIRAAAGGLAERGVPALSAGEMFSLRAPEVALLADHPVHAQSFGWAWHALDAQYRFPTTVLRTRSLGSTPLERFTTLVIPALTQEAELTRMLGDAGVARLKQWVSDGGTLVAIASGADWVQKTLELGKLRDWYDENKVGTGDTAVQRMRVSVPGAFVRASFDTESWMASGYGADFPALVTSNRVWLAPNGPADARKRVVARYAPAESLHIAGHLWPENRERLPGAVLAYEERIGSGRVILFAEDPNFRGYWRGADRLFLNAVLLAPSAP